VKFAADVKPVDGWPAYSIDHAAPLLADPSTLEGGNFFGGAFGIWLGEDSDAHGSPLCRPVRIHELLRMIGVGDETLSNVPTHLAIKRLRIAPGVRGLATVLAALKTAEAKAPIEIDCSSQFVCDTNLHSFMLCVAPHEPIPDPAPVPVNEFVLEQALTLPLPMNTAWMQAVQQDEDLRYIRDCLHDNVPVVPAELSEKAYATLAHNDQLEQQNGISILL
jgi:hypothetical protein